MAQQRVLVTGGSGFIAGHCILQLLEQGYRVRATLRSLDKEPTVRAVLTAAEMTDGEALSFVAADLLSDGWPEAVARTMIMSSARPTGRCSTAPGSTPTGTARRSPPSTAR